MDERTPDESERRKAIKLRQRQENEDAKWLLKSRQGRRIVWRELERAGVFQTVFNQNSMAMAFNEGRRNGGLYWLAKVHELNPEAYALMVQENNDDRNTDSRSDTSDQ